MKARRPRSGKTAKSPKKKLAAQRPKRLPPEKIAAMSAAAEQRRRLQRLSILEAEAAMMIGVKKLLLNDREALIGFLEGARAIVSLHFKRYEVETGSSPSDADIAWKLAHDYALAVAIEKLKPSPPKRKRRKVADSADVFFEVKELELDGNGIEEAVATVARNRKVSTKTIYNHVRDFRERVLPDPRVLLDSNH